MPPLPRLSDALSTEWQEHGACREHDGTVFFPPTSYEPKAEREAREAEAKAICDGCAVRTPCLEWALSVQEPYGVWGGWTESERRALLEQRREAS